MATVICCFFFMFVFLNIKTSVMREEWQDVDLETMPYYDVILPSPRVQAHIIAIMAAKEANNRNNEMLRQADAEVSAAELLRKSIAKLEVRCWMPKEKALALANELTSMVIETTEALICAHEKATVLRLAWA